MILSQFSVYFLRYLLVMVLSLCTCLFHNLFTFFSLFVSTNFVPDSYWISELKCTSDFFHTLICSKLTFYLFSAYKILFLVLCMLILCVETCRKIFVFVQTLQLVSIFNVCVWKYCFCNAWSCSSIISQSVSFFTSPSDCQMNLFSLANNCLHS